MHFPPHLMLSIGFVLHTISSTTCLQSSHDHREQQNYATDCGARPARSEHRDPGDRRQPRIIAGAPTQEGQFPWQASLELLHPSMGFLGHWCGAVLIHRFWILSAAHCVHNDLFNLPLPPLWTVVLGEHDRLVESGYEQRIPVEKIVLHKRYQNFLHDLVLMKLSMPADLSTGSNVRRICLPFVYNEANSEHQEEMELDDDPLESNDPLDGEVSTLPEKADNFLRSVQHMRRHRNVTRPSMSELMSTKILGRLRQAEERSRAVQWPRRRNDKLMKVRTAAEAAEYAGLMGSQQQQRRRQRPSDQSDYRELPYVDCVATGWGKSNLSSDLTDVLLKTRVPLHNNNRCRDAYGSFVRIHRGHLCAGNLHGKSGTCVGDSGGPLQCRLSRNGPWILAGITSFGSGCAIKGFPDVYTRTSYYMKWIQDTIAYE